MPNIHLPKNFSHSYHPERKIWEHQFKCITSFHVELFILKKTSLKYKPMVLEFDILPLYVTDPQRETEPGHVVELLLLSLYPSTKFEKGK